MGKEARVCLSCGKHFIGRVTKDRIRKFCCVKCFDIYKINRNTFKCLNCGSKFEQWKSRGVRKFCCYKCSVYYKKKMRKTTSIDRFYTGFICNINNGCWNWIKTKNPAGYGVTTYCEKKYLAHRLSWILHNGDIPNELMVCHRKDNPSCVNPKHLFLGTAQDNATDMVQKGRTKSKLTEEDLIKIKKLTKQKLTRKEIAEKLNVGVHIIKNIRRKIKNTIK